MIGKRGFSLSPQLVLGAIGCLVLIALITFFIMGGGGSTQTEEVRIALPDTYPQ